MHYIRLLRPPSLEKSDRLKLVLTVTTDLGDSFLCTAKPVPISVSIRLTEPHKASGSTAAHVKIDDGSITWRYGLRVLKLEIPLPGQLARKVTAASNSLARIQISASRRPVDPPNIADIPFDNEGRILGISVPFPMAGKQACYIATREFAISPKLDGFGGMLRIDEEIGESIDRHVWDAGVVTTGLLFDMCGSITSTKWPETPLLQGILSSAAADCPLNVIELGCGVGILGIGLVRALSARALQILPREAAQEEINTLEAGDIGGDLADADAVAVSDVGTLPRAPTFGNLLLTDLSDAEELTIGNIIGYQEMQNGPGPFQLTFESLDWEDGKNGVFGPKASTTGWDLVIISDCTYNVDMLSALVDTLSALHRSSVALGKNGTRVMLATKPRHSDEKALFDLMETKGWRILESATRVLPVLGLDDERVDIYLFGKA